MDYWCDRNFCQEEDKTIQRHNASLMGEIERLRGDTKIAKLHDTAVAWRHDSFAKAMKDEEYRALMAFINHAPLTTHARAICKAIASEILESPQSWPFSCLVRE